MKRLAVAVCLILLCSSTAFAGPRVTKMFHRPSGEVIDNSLVVLTRLFTGIRLNVKTAEVAPGHVYTLWVFVYNRPNNCMEPVCTFRDWPNPDVRASVFYVTGEIAPGSGTYTTNAFIPLGAIPLNRDQVVRERHRFGVGLQDARRSEIHIRLRDHGPTRTGTDLTEQLNVHSGGCEIYTCSDTHEARFARR